jgi:hypothetical protein
MRSSTGKLVLVVVAGLLAATVLMAQAGATNVPNWTVPPYRSQSASGGLQTMVDISEAAIFVAITTCRVFDTRDPVGPFGGPRLIANMTRNFDIDSGPCTGIPAGSAAYSMNFGAILPDGANSFITIWPTGAAQPTSSFMNPVFGTVVANAAIVPAGTGGSISVFPNTGVHLYGDINGYFMDQGGNLNTGVNLQWQGDTTNSFMFVHNANTSSGSETTNAIRGFIDTTQNSAAGAHTGPAGVYGWSDGTSGVNFGVIGRTSSTATAAAGVKGYNASDFPGTGLNQATWAGPAAFRAGGSDGDLAVLTQAEPGTSALIGTITDSAGGGAVWGYVGLGLFATNYGFYSVGPSHISGTFTASTKLFVEPHPTDPTKEIRYVSLEGPAAEVYFRGSAQVQRGVTRITIPDYFRLVASPGSYSTLVTPVGAMATVAVRSEGPDGIVIEASRDVKIHYVVYAERETFKGHQPIADTDIFRPVFEGGTESNFNLRGLPDSFMRRLVSNGTLRPDGSLNMETVRRVGWELKPADKAVTRTERVRAEPLTSE